MCYLKCLVTALLLAAGSVQAVPFDEGIAAYERQDFATAVRLWRPLAAAGNAYAQFNLGLMYGSGKGVPKDEQQAVIWYRKAADQGYVGAQRNLGIMYEVGAGIPKDEEHAAAWYRMAAEQGDAVSQFNLAAMYATGRGVPSDVYWEVIWLQKSADQGYARAQFNIGVIREFGKGLPKDEQQAAEYYLKAALQRHPGAQFNLALLFEKGRGLPRDLRQAAVWYRKAADQGAADAQNNLANLYANGQGVIKDEQQAYFWAILASMGGDEWAPRHRDFLETRLTVEQRTAAQAEARNWRPSEGGAPEVFSNRPGPDASKRADSTGSGFRVAAGRIVTNNHVVENCLRIRVNGKTAGQVIARDARNDIAVVAAAGDQGPAASVRLTRSRLGEEVTVAGFPLQGLLSGLSVTQGSVSRLSGLAGDTRLLQISAPVQPGNSGGPLLDGGGSVIGVVVSKLDALRVAKATGDIPQNVNFALNANLLRAFLDANDVAYVEGNALRPLSSPDVAMRAAGFTVLIECWNQSSGG